MSDRLAQAWDEAANGYDAYFVPRFAPWVRDAVAAITDAALPDGPVLVPCCGTFPEVDLLAGRFPDREIVGIDLSPGMIRLAQERAARWPRASAVVADASTLDARWSGRCGAVVSAFGLQQLPEPLAALRSWTSALAPRGRLSVLFWPHITEAEGPFALLSDVVASAGESTWEDDLVTALRDAGATVERDERLVHGMSHVDAAAFFDAFDRAGPLRALAIARGDAFVAQLREAFLRRAPTGEWRHRPAARLLLARRG